MRRLRNLMAKRMDYNVISIIHRKGKAITFFLKDGEHLSYDNIFDVTIDDLKEEDGKTNVDEKV